MMGSHLDMRPLDRRLAAAYSIALLGAVLAPIRQNWRSKPRKDGFPLSYYPMFTARRRSTATIHSLVGVCADGRRIRLPHTIAGTGGLNQVRRQIARCVTEGRAEELCERASRELVRRNGRGRGPFSAVIAVDVVASKFRLDESFGGAGLVGEETVLATLACVATTGGHI